MSGFSDDLAGGVGILIRVVLQSDNYVPGVSGWAIFRDGTAEFNSVNIRGGLVAGDPNGAHIAVIPQLTTRLQAVYGALLASVTDAAIYLYASDGSYRYEIIGLQHGSNRTFYACGTVSADDFLREEMQVNWPTGTKTSMSILWDQTATSAQNCIWIFGNNAGASKSINNQAQFNGTDVQFGPGAGDTGSVTAFVKSEFKSTVKLDQGAEFVDDAVLDAAAALLFSAGASVRITDVDTRSINITPTAINTPTTQAVAYGRTLQGTKTFVVLCPHTGVPQNVHVGSGSLTMTGCNVTIDRSDSATTTTIDVITIATG